MKKTLLLALLLLIASLFTGCSNQPVAVGTSSLGKPIAPSKTLSGNETEFMTGTFNFKLFGNDYTIIGKDGSEIKIEKGN
jgi:predicted small secreted protein